MPSKISRLPFADVALLGVAVVWGSSYLAAKELVGPGTVAPVLALRFGVAVAGLAILLLPRLRRLTAAELRIGGLLGLILSLIFALETVGVTRTSATNAGLIISLTMVITPILDRAAPRFFIAAAVAIAGVVLLTQSGGLTAPSLGDLLMLGAAMVRAVHILVMKRASAGRTLDSGRVTLIQLAVAFVVFTVYATVAGPGVATVASGLTGRGRLLLVYLALFCTVFAFAVQMWAVRASSPSRVSLLLGTEPLWAAVVGLTFGGDRLGVPGLIGAILILAGAELGRRLDGAGESRASSGSEPAAQQL